MYYDRIDPTLLPPPKARSTTRPTRPFDLLVLTWPWFDSASEGQRKAALTLNAIVALCLEPGRTSLPKRLRDENRLRDALQLAVDIPPLLAKTAVSCDAGLLLFERPNLGEAAAAAALDQVIRLAGIEDPCWADQRSTCCTVDFADALKSKWRRIAVDVARPLMRVITNYRVLGLPLPLHKRGIAIALIALACDNAAAPHECAWALRATEMERWGSSTLLLDLALIPETVVNLAFDQQELAAIRERVASAASRVPSVVHESNAADEAEGGGHCQLSCW